MPRLRATLCIMNEIVFVNTMKHACTIMDSEGQITHVFPGKGAEAATAKAETVSKEVGGFNVELTEYTEVQNIPEEKEGVIYIASKLICGLVESQGREDFVSPNTGDSAFRNEKKQVIGVQGFTKNA